MSDTQKKVEPKKGIIERLKRPKADADKANEKANADRKGARFWLPSRVDLAGHGPRTSDDPFEGTPRQISFPRILRKGKEHKIRGEVYLGELKGDRGIMIEHIMHPGQLRHDRAEILKKGLLTEADFEAMDKGKHPDEHKSTPNEMPEMRIGDIDHLTDLEASAYCTKHNILLPADADLLVKRQYIKAALSKTR